MTRIILFENVVCYRLCIHSVPGTVGYKLLDLCFCLPSASMECVCSAGGVRGRPYDNLEGPSIVTTSAVVREAILEEGRRPAHGVLYSR